MTDWAGQASAGAEQWMTAQQEWWRTVLNAGAGQTGPVPPQWQREAIETWRAAAHRVADAQADVLLQGLGSAKPSQAEDLLAQWTATQRRLWEGWIAAVGGAAGGGGPPPAAATPPPGFQEAGQRLVQALQESAEQLVKAQEEWARTLRRRPDDGGAS